MPPVVVKKYANRRLYNTETSSYITLDNLAGMIRAGRDFIVYDAKSGEDITRGVLTQIIVEEESKGSAMLPTPFLRQLIGFYGGNLQGVVPRYLEYTMSSFARQQQQMRTMMERTLSPYMPPGVEEMSRQNIALFERAFGMWNPFHPTGEEQAEAGSTEQAGPMTDTVTDTPVTEAPGHAATGSMTTGSMTTGKPGSVEIEQLRLEIESLQRQLAAAHASALTPKIDAVSGHAPANVLRDPPTETETETVPKALRRMVRGNSAARS